jgi:DNA-binding NarL/FixJ family response regulator
MQVESTEDAITQEKTANIIQISQINPINSAILDYVKQVHQEETPTANEQRDLVRSIKQNIPEANVAIGERNQGLLAVICYDFSLNPFNNPQTVMKVARDALVQAALTYDLRDTFVSFTNFAISFVRESLLEEFGSLSEQTKADSPQTMYEVYRFLSRVKDISTDEEKLDAQGVVNEQKRRTKYNEKALKLFNLREKKVLPYLHLSTDQIAEVTGESPEDINRFISSAHKKIGVHARPALARYLEEQGFSFDVKSPPAPLHELFDSQEMSIIQSLYYSDDEISELMNIPKSSVVYLVNKLTIRLEARSRTEAFLMAHRFDTGERHEPYPRTKKEKLVIKLGWATLDIIHLEETLENVTPRTANLIRAYYLSDEDVLWKDVAPQFSLSNEAAIVAARHGILKIRKLSQDKTHDLSAIIG